MLCNIIMHISVIIDIFQAQKIFHYTHSVPSIPQNSCGQPSRAAQPTFHRPGATKLRTLHSLDPRTPSQPSSPPPARRGSARRASATPRRISGRCSTPPAAPAPRPPSAQLLSALPSLRIRSFRRTPQPKRPTPSEISASSATTASEEILARSTGILGGWNLPLHAARVTHRLRGI